MFRSIGLSAFTTRRVLLISDLSNLNINRDFGIASFTLPRPDIEREATVQIDITDSAGLFGGETSLTKSYGDCTP
jgi:hypothetical protein